MDRSALLQVTSPLPGEGKSMTAANLAATLGPRRQARILVDADFRRPIQHKLFGLRNTYGLTLALLGHADSLESLMQETGVANLHLLTTGPLPPNPSELLGSKRMQNVVMDLLNMADVVVIDSLPVTVVSDTAIIASMVDGVLLVLRAGHTRNDYAKRAMAVLHHVNARVLGFVLNDVSAKATGYHYDYGYNYGYAYVMAEEPSGAQKGVVTTQRRRPSHAGGCSWGAAAGRTHRPSRPRFRDAGHGLQRHERAESGSHVMTRRVAAEMPPAVAGSAKMRTQIVDACG
ncbi:MAG: CpsD/CapB family tyrosine-protein kinase [Caldilineaceae bacterium]